MIVTLCGSNRFEDTFVLWNKALSLAGNLVFTTSVYPMFENGVKEWYRPEEKVMLDLVHKEKIRVSYAIVVLNVHSYIGESTISEIEFARMTKKKIFVLESWGERCGPPAESKDVFGKTKADYGIPKDFVSPMRLVDGEQGVEKASFGDLFGYAGPRRSRLIDMIHGGMSDSGRRDDSGR